MSDTQDISIRRAQLTPAQQEKLRQRLQAKGTIAAHPAVIGPREPGSPAYLSYAQCGLWLTWKLAPESPAYNLAGSLRLQGELNLAALQASLNAVIARHEILRSVIADHDSEPPTLQLLSPPSIELNAVRLEDSDAALDEALRAFAARPYALDREAPVRVELYQLNPSTHVLALGVHHIAADGWSLRLLVDEILAYYACAARGEPDPLPALAIQFSDYAAWERARLDGAERARQIAYWRDRLGDDHTCLDLPSSRPRAARGPGREGRHHFVLNPELTTALRALARGQGASVFVMMMSLLDILLHRLSGQPRIRVGTPLANRHPVQTHGLIGYLLNLQVLQIALSGDASLLAVLRQVQQALAGAQENQDLPFDALVDALQPQRQNGVHPLFQVKCTQQDDVAPRRQVAGLEVDIEVLNAGHAHFDLSLDFTDRQDGIACVFAYDAELFDATLIASYAQAFVACAQQAIEAPQRPIREFQLSAAGELIGPLRRYPHTHVLSLWDAAREKNPHALALRCGERTLDYAALDAAANALAARMQRLGIGAESRIGVYADRSLKGVIAMLAVLKAGAVYMPMDPALPAQRLAYQLSDSGARLLLYAQMPSWSPAVPCQAITLDEPPRSSEAALDLPRHPDQAAYLIYTSGSTGRPKGVTVSHAALANYVQAVLDAMALPESARSMAMVSTVAADLGHTALFGALLSGRQLHLLDADCVFDPDRFAHYMRTHTVDVLKIVPSHLQALLSASRPADVLPRACLVLGGEATGWPLVERIAALRPELRLLNHYGPTETTVGALTQVASEALREAASLPTGRPLANTQAHVLDVYGQPVLDGVPGELYLGGAGLARGYEGRPGQTAERFVANPFSETGERLYRTGDRVRRLHDGSLEFLGRVDDQVKIRGYRVELREVTQMLRQQPGVIEAEVIARESEDGQRRLLGYVVAKTGSVLDSQELKEQLGQRLPDYMVPAAIMLLDALPLTANGKVDRKALPEPGQQRDERYEAPQGEIETALAEVWAEVLRRDQVGRNDNFFEIGGDSILSLQIVARTRKRGYRITPKQVFEHQTIRRLAEGMEGKASEPIMIPALEAERRIAPLPLSYAQQRLWILWNLDPESTAYHMDTALKLTGVVDVDALRTAFNGLVARHEALRTVFRLNETGTAEQCIHPPGGTVLEVRDLGDRNLALEVARIHAEPFDLTQGPLLRAVLLKEAQEQHVLAVVMHHIVSDGWTMKLVVDDLIEGYRAGVEDRKPVLAVLPIQYADYAVWQRNWLEGRERERQLKYWMEQLSGDQPVLDLATDHPRRSDGRYAQAVHSLELPADVVNGLRVQAKSTSGTVFMGLLAGMHALLHRYSGQEDIRVGVPVANRHHAGTDGVAGVFVNTQVQRARLNGQTTFAVLLKQVRESALGAQSHQDLPFEELVEALQPERSLSRTPLFQVMFNHQRQDREEKLAQLPGLKVERYGNSAGQEAKFELSVNANEAPDGRVSVRFEYARELFEDSTIERMAGHYVAVLRALAENSDQAVGEVELLCEAERTQLAAWGVNSERYSDVAPIHRLIESRVTENPDAAALVFGEDELSYAECNARANRLAHRLIALGVGPEVRVGVALERSVELVVSLLAILKAGGAYVPLDPDYPAERLAYMMEDSGIGLLLTHSMLRQRLPVADGMPVVEVDDLDLSHESAINPDVPVSGENLCYVIYTSGSTGRPKGAQLCHSNVCRLLAATDAWFQFAPSDVWTLFHSYAFDFSVWEVFGALCTGGKLVVVPYWVSRSPDDFLALLRGQQVTVLNQTPSAFGQLIHAVEQGAEGGQGLALKHVIFGGEALEPEMLRPWMDRFGDEAPRLVNMYGITETTVHVTYRPITRADLEEGHRSPVGLNIPDLGLKVLDGNLNQAPIGVPGELYVSGDGLARGYLNRSALTAERFVADPFDGAGGRLYRTGDLVKWNAKGELEYLGRIDHQVKIRGFRVELGEIEAKLLGQPQVREAVVVASEGPGGARLVGYVSLHAPIDAAQLRERLDKELPEYMVPSIIMALDALPLNANGKIDRRALPTPEVGAEGDYEAPSGEVEEMLAAIWSDVLKVPVEKVGRTSNFFELGGNSLLAIQILARVRMQLHCSVQLSAFFKRLTIAGLAGLIGQSGTIDPQADAGLALAPVPRDQALRLAPTQRRIWAFDRLMASNNAARAAYNVTVVFELNGDLNPVFMQAAIDYLLDRHEVLRTAYPEDGDGDPIAVIVERIAAPIERFDLSDLPQGAVSTAFAEIHARTAAVPFDMARGPLLRVALVRIAERRHRLIAAVHHIVFDGWSAAVFTEEFCEVYQALRAGREPALAPLAIQYADYAVWHDKLLRARQTESHAFWNRYLQGAPRQSVFPADRARPKIARHDGDMLRVQVEQPLCGHLKKLARDWDVSLFALLLTTYLLVLHRRAGVEDVVVGTDVAGRGHPDLERLIGFFINVVPIRSRLAAEDTPLRLWARQIQQSVAEVFDYQSLPLDQIMTAAQIARGQAANPLIQMLFVMQNMPKRRFDIDGLEIEVLPTGAVSSKFDMAVFVHEAEDALSADWVFATELYDRANVAAIAAAWRDALDAIVTKPEITIGALSVQKCSEGLLMSTPNALGKTNKLDMLKSFARAKAPASAAPAHDAQIRISYPSPGRRFPVMIEALDRDLDSVWWAVQQRDFIEEKLRTHAGIIFRNFGLNTPQDFERFSEAMEPKLYGAYGDLPKKEGGINTYRSTPYPEKQMILYHNECSHTDRWPRKQWFFCELPSRVGGITPIVDCREMLTVLPREIVEEMADKGLLYVRNFHPKLDVSWQHFFKTENRAEVDARLQRAGIEWAWLDGDVLQTRTRAPAVITHPLTGAQAFFNQVQLHHVSCLEPEVREDLLAMVGLERMPRQVYFGDGSPIPDATMDLIGKAYEACAVRLDWQRGDVVMLDNMLAAHARDPYEEPRKIVVAMGAMYVRDADGSMRLAQP